MPWNVNVERGKDNPSSRFFVLIRSVRQDVRAPGSQGTTVNTHQRSVSWMYDCAVASAALAGLSRAVSTVEPRPQRGL